MIQISFWAKNHKLAARAIIGLSHTLLFAAAVYVAILLRQINVYIHYIIPIIAFVLLVLSVLFYSIQGNTSKSFTNNYIKRKGCEIVFLLSTLICICFIFNKDSRVNKLNIYNTLSGSFTKEKDEVKEQHATTNKLSGKNLKKQFKVLLKELKKSRKSTGGKIALIFLVIFWGLTLSTLVAALSCNLSCSGNEGAAALVLIAGFAAVIFLMIILIRSINKSENKKKNMSSSAVPNP